MLVESIKMALFSLMKNKLRSFLTMLGIIVGIGSVITITALGEGGKNEILGEFNQIGASTAMISVKSNHLTSGNLIKDQDLKALSERLSGLKALSPLSQKFSSMTYLQKKHNLVITAFNEPYEKIMNLELIRGQGFTPFHYESNLALALIEESSALKVFGRSDPVEEIIEVNLDQRKVKIQIIGISRSSISKMLSFSPSSSAETPIFIFMPYSALTKLDPSHQGARQLAIMTETADQLDQVTSQALEVIESAHLNRGQAVYRVQKLADIIKQIDSVVSLITSFIAAVAAVSLLVGGIGVMNIMLVSVSERTREIGIRKALGASTSDILSQFIIEAVILTSLGGLLGIVFGLGLASILAKLASIKAVFTLSSFLIAVLFSSLVGLFFGIYPAFKAAKLHPIDALRFE